MNTKKTRFNPGILLNAVPHISLVLSLMHLVFLVVDLFNRAMAFVSNDITKWLLLTSAALTLILCADLHANVREKNRIWRIWVRISTVSSALTAFVFVLDYETRIINTTTVKYLLYIFTLSSLLLSVYGIVIHRKKLLSESES